MAAYRPIHISYWQDKFILSLTPEQKYFYLYLMTNSKTKQCGIYELPKNVICFETGYNLETINKLLTFFIQSKKILYDDSTEEIFIKNWVKFNQIDNKNIFICVLKELKELKSKVFLTEFAKCIDNINLNKNYNQEIKGACKGLIRGYTTPTKKESKEETETQEEEESKEETETGDTVFDKFWNLYNKKVGKKENVLKKFNSLTEDQRTKIFETLPDYVKSTPDKKFRKNPETYLNNFSWNDEIIFNGVQKERRNSTQEFKPVNQI